MANNQKLMDLDWLLQAIKSEGGKLHKISFYLSQPTTSCYKETDTSININISTDNSSLQCFSPILTAIHHANNPQVLEFQKVTWDSNQLQNLCSLLDNNPSIKQLIFRRNRFSPEGLSQISERLKRNIKIKEVVFCKSHIGSFGAEALASALKVNECLEELQIWEDSIGIKGAEEISKMIEVNCSLKLLTILDSNFSTATPLISAVVARNRVMEVHVWSGENTEKSFKVVDFAPANSTLRIYKLDLSGCCRVTCALGWNTTVKSLDMTGIRLKSKWAKLFRQVLEQNQTLKEVNLSKTCLKDKGVVYVAAGLFKNQYLENLYLDGNWFGGIGVEHLLCPLSKFSGLQNQANTSLKSVTFGGGRTKIGRGGLVAILQMLTTNQTLTRLGIYDDESLKEADFIQIFKSLENNATLSYLSLQGCRGVQGDLVLKAIMEMLQINPWIEAIDLTRTPLYNSGNTEGISQKIGQNGRRIEHDMDLLKDMPLSTPKSCRLFLCGQEFAGKSTLCNSISQNFSSRKVPYLDQVRTLVNPVEQAVRTQGIKIKTLKDEDTKISIWDLAGQHEFYTIHDLMFPGQGSASFFFIVSSLFRKPHNKEQKSPAETEEDLLYWLRFIVSNSKRAGPQALLPNVTLVLTHFDKVSHSSESFQVTIRLIQRLGERFQGFVELYSNVFTIDARSSGSVSKLTDHIRMTSKTILQRVPQVYKICNEIIQILAEWRSENYNKPALKWKEFCELCQVKIPALRIRSRHDNLEKVEMRRRAVANSLHHIGEIIYFEGLGFLILDCEWFCTGVLGQLVNIEARRGSSVDKDGHGFVKRMELEKILRGSLHNPIPGMGSKMFENMEAADLVRMMLKLEICYEQNPGDQNSLLLIPFLLEEGRGRSQRWQTSVTNSVYAGRHLECDDSSHMCLTPGFFPKLQVHLYNKISGSNNQHGATYSLEKYLITLSINGIYVRVELGGQLGHYIDVLACSTKSLTETIRLFHQLIIPAIQSVCHGATLSEHILRPECVKYLTPPRYRKTQSVCLQQLKQTILSVPADGMYEYQHTWNTVTDGGRLILQAGFDFARDLLSDDDFREVLHRRYNDLYHLAVELAVPLGNTPDRPDQPTHPRDEGNIIIDPTFNGIARGVEAVLHRLKIIEQEIRDLKQEIQGLRYYERRLLTELHCQVNYLVNYNVQVEERKVPNMFYFVQTENYRRKLVTNIITGMTALRLHMLCEFRKEIHVVDDQMGCEMMHIDNIAVTSLVPYMKKFMTLLTFALKIGAHIAAGMGEMIPDLSREVARLIDPSVMYGAAGAVAAGSMGAAAIGRVQKSRQQNQNVTFEGDNTRNLQQDLRVAQQWLLDFLKDRRCSTGKTIAEKFGLWRVRYRDNGHIAWICRRHMQIRANEIIEVPM
ncbi:Protein TORNADO 1 [Ranunculus cassubicifolius]